MSWISTVLTLTRSWLCVCSKTVLCRFLLYVSLFSVLVSLVTCHERGSVGATEDSQGGLPRCPLEASGGHGERGRADASLPRKPPCNSQQRESDGKLCRDPGCTLSSETTGTAVSYTLGFLRDAGFHLSLTHLFRWLYKQ